MKRTLLPLLCCMMFTGPAIAQDLKLPTAKINSKGVPVVQPVKCSTKELRSAKIRSGTTPSDVALKHFLGRWCGVDQNGNSVKLAIVDIIPPEKKGSAPLAELMFLQKNGSLTKGFGVFFGDRTTKSIALDLNGSVIWFVQDGVMRFADWRGISSGRVKKNGFNSTLTKR